MTNSSTLQILTARATSTTTRIETVERYTLQLLTYVCESNIHYNKDWDWSAKYLNAKWMALREQHPLQQGLRHHSGDLCPVGQLPARATSTTTRIETFLTYCDNVLQHCLREQHPLQQGLRLAFTQIETGIFFCESNIHYNKDWDLQVHPVQRVQVRCESNIHYNKDWDADYHCKC